MNCSPPETCTGQTYKTNNVLCCKAHGHGTANGNLVEKTGNRSFRFVGISLCSCVTHFDFAGILCIFMDILCVFVVAFSRCQQLLLSDP